MIHCNTQFGKLKEVIVGRELELPERSIDITFKYFYKDNIGKTLYNSNYTGYTINKDILYKRIQQLDNLEKTLVQLGVKVYRPEPIKFIKKIKTPFFESESTQANNVRDLTLIYNNIILETPICIRNRIFENIQLFKIFKKVFNNGLGGKWLKSPNTHLLESTLDLDDWKNNRDFNIINSKYEMAIDAPNFLTIGKDVIVNVSNYNQYLGLQWVKSIFPESKFHQINITDNHIDGIILNLKPGFFLLNPNFIHLIDQLPDKFKKYKFIIPEKTNVKKDLQYSDIDIYLSSQQGMDLNILSIDENTIIVNKRAINVIHILEKNKFNVIPVELDYGEIFGGGIHCSTLDLVRDDNYDFY